YSEKSLQPDRQAGKLGPERVPMHLHPRRYHAMKKCSVWVALALVLLSAPLSVRADFIVVTQLSGAGENPPTNSPALGTATYTVNSALTEIDFTITFTGLTTPLQAGHIHFGVPGMNGPVILPYPNLPAGSTSGTFSGALTAANLTPAGPIATF